MWREGKWKHREKELPSSSPVSHSKPLAELQKLLTLPPNQRVQWKQLKAQAVIFEYGLINHYQTRWITNFPDASFLYCMHWMAQKLQI